MKITLPLFLGKSSEENGYFFLAMDEEVVKYIKHCTTRNLTFWCYSTSLPDFLDLGEVPESILNDVVNFVGGPVEVTTLVTTGKRSKRDSVVIPTSQEVHGEQNVKSTDIPKEAKRKRRNETESSSSSSGELGSQRRVPIPQNPNTEDSSSSTTKDPGSSCEERIGGGQQAKTSDGHSDLRGLSSTARSGTGSSDETRQSLPGRMSELGILDNSWGRERRVHEDSTDTIKDDGGLDGDVGAGLKPKRKRRTKLEMEEARRLASLQSLI
jgi:hypothetical protein